MWRWEEAREARGEALAGLGARIEELRQGIEYHEEAAELLRDDLAVLVGDRERLLDYE